MKECRKCIHYSVCLHNRCSGENFERATELFGCKMFEDKDNFVFFPVRAGDALYYEKDGEIKCSTVDRISYEEIGDDVYTQVDGYGYSVFFEDVGKLVYREDDLERK